MKPVSNRELSKFLRNHNNVKGFINYLKIVYRPYICPFNLMFEYIPENSTIMDIGCGQGQFMLLMAEYCKPLRIKGIDVLVNSIQEAKQLFSSLAYPNVTFEVYDGISLPIDTPYYELLTMIDVFHHIPRDMQEEFIMNLYNRMTNGGRFLIKEIDRSSLLVYANKLHDLILAGEVGNEISRNRMKYLLQNKGFDLIAEGCKVSYWYPHYWFLVGK